MPRVRRSSMEEQRVSTIGSRNASIEPDVWEYEEMRDALAAREISTVYRLLRRRGVSQRQIAAMTGQSQSEVSEILKGRQVMAYDVLARIADGLGVPRGYLGLADDDSHNEEDEARKRRKFLAHAAAIAVSAHVLGSNTAGPDSDLWTPYPARTPTPARIDNTDGEDWLRFLSDTELLDLGLAQRSAERPPFDAFFEAHFPRLVRHLLPLCQGDRHRAEDLAQEAFLQAYRKWDQLRRPERAYAWLCTIGSRLCWAFLAKCTEQAKLSHEVAAISPCVVASPEYNVMLDIARAVEKLPPRERLVARLKLIFEMTPTEIAAAVGVAPGTVRAQLHAARQKLKALLDPDDDRERPAT